MKQTAVDFLVEKYFFQRTIYSSDILKAKEMEKEQIIDSYEVAYMDGYNDNGKDGKQYYNETFKNKQDETNKPDCKDKCY